MTLYDGSDVQADIALRRIGETVSVSDEFKIQNSTDENDGSKDYNRSFEAVKGEWSTYRLTSYKGQELVANMVLTSPTFDLINLTNHGYVLKMLIEM